MDISEAAGKVICNAIDHAEIVYRNKEGEELFTQSIGTVRAGDEIKINVPLPTDFHILISPGLRFNPANPQNFRPDANT